MILYAGAVFSVFLFFFEGRGDIHVFLHELFGDFLMIRSYKVYKFKVGGTVSILKKVKAITSKTKKVSDCDDAFGHHYPAEQCSKAPGWLFDIGDYTTQFYRDYNKPL